MKISDLYITTIRVLKRYSKEHPNVAFRIGESEDTVEVKELIAGLKKMLGWLYKDLSTENIEKVTHCYDCRYYKKYKKKGVAKGGTFYACSIDKLKHRPDFFCKDGEPKRNNK